MNGYHIGKLIGIERKRRGVTQKQLALGIFTSQMLYKLETNGSESDKLQVDILLQRLGRSPDKLEIFMPMAEYQKIRARDLIEELILKKKISKVEYLLEKYKEYYGENNNVHMMYYNRSKAYLILRTDGDLDEALKYIVNAIDWTLEGWNKRSLKEYIISTYEMENLLVYGKILYLMGQVDEAREHLEKCLEYIENQYIDADTEEYAKIYPKCAWLLSKVYQGSEHNERIIQICEKALDYLRREAIGYFAIPVMEEIIPCYRRMGNDEKASYWQTFYDTLKGLYDEYAPEMCLDSLFSNVCQREYHLDYETIKGERQSKGYTQEDIIDGIFQTAKSLSIIENHKKTPSKKHFEQLMDNMGIEKRRYNGLLATTSFDILQKKNVLDYFCCISDYDSADGLLDELKESLDSDVEDNRRFIEANRIIIDYSRSIITAEEALERCKLLLAETYNVDAKKNRPPMRNEAIIINQMGICLGNMDRIAEKVELLGKIKSYYEKSKVDVKYNVRSYMPLKVNYIRALLDLGSEKKAMLLAIKTMLEELKFAKTRTLSQYCIVLACVNMKDRSLEVYCKDYLKKAYNICKFNYEEISCRSIADYYKNVYKEDITYKDRLSDMA